ncbi:MAG: transporter substrate-binding domain-containing protein, partial [Ruthenibacterium sp.]
TQDEVLNAVRSGAADVGLGAFSADDKRLDKVQPTNFYAGGTQTLLMCIEDAKSYGTLKAFATKTIACLRGEPKQREIVIELLPDDCAIKEVHDVDAGIKKLRSGTCAALMLDEFQGIAYADDNPDLALLRVPLTTETHCDAKVMAVMCDNKSLLDFVNTNIIEKYKKTGGLGRLMLSARVKADNRGLLDAVSDGAADSNLS